jgi:hypothetical protein
MSGQEIDSSTQKGLRAHRLIRPNPMRFALLNASYKLQTVRRNAVRTTLQRR